MSPASILFGVFVLATPQKAAPAQPPTDQNLVRIYLYTDKGGDPEELEGRRESLKDLSSALAGKGKRVHVMDGQDSADAVLEVIDRGYTIPKVVIGMGARPGQPPGVGWGPARAVHLRVRLTCGGDSVPFTNRNTAIEQSGGWKSAADDIARQIDKWIADHKDRILALR